MCGRYSFFNSEEIGRRFRVDKIPKEVRDRYNAAPGQFMPVVLERGGKRTLKLMKWGLVPMWAKDMNIGYKLINARSETVFDKPVWRGVIKRQRCLVPATGFYEWKKIDTDGQAKKQPYFIHPTALSMFAFAGVWSTWQDAEKNDWQTYSILTTAPNSEMSRIHDRMPVILHPENEASWLSATNDGDQRALSSLLQPWEDHGLEIFKVSTDINVTKNDDEHLIYPLNSQ